MNKFFASTTIALALFCAPLALAQVYYQSSTGCVSIATGLTTGSRGSSVLSLQQFLVAQNYPGGGTWMETGYFGAATAAALRNFQSTHGLPQSGYVDASTASAIESASCLPGQSGVSTYPSNYTSTYPYTYPTIPTTYPSSYSYPSTLNYYGNYNQAPVITSLSQNTGNPGQVITIYGVGFQSYNTINFGGTILQDVPSGGTSISFTIPSTITSYSYSYSGTPVQLSVENSAGTSNALTFTIWGSAPNVCGSNYLYDSSSCGSCPTYPYNTSYGYTNTNCAPLNTSNATISYLNPTSGGVGTDVTIFGSGFSSSGNTVHFGTGIISNLNSPDGLGLSFVVPAQLTGYGTQPLTLSTYQVSVTNGWGITSNAVPFSVTALSDTGTPTISGVNGPTSLAVGQQGLWSLTLNTQNDPYITTTVSWGDQGTYGASAQPQTFSGSQAQTFTHTYYQTGTYTIVFTVSNGSGQNNTFTTTVSVSNNGTSNNLSLSYLSPNSAYVGQQVTIYGSGFVVGSNNTINFGQGAIQNAYSSNGTSISFTVPSSVGPYCAPGTACPQYAISITPGTYNISVMDQNGTSNVIPLTVQ